MKPNKYYVGDLVSPKQINGAIWAVLSYRWDREWETYIYRVRYDRPTEHWTVANHPGFIDRYYMESDLKLHRDNPEDVFKDLLTEGV